MGGQVRTMYHAHACNIYRIYVYVRVNLVDACTHYTHMCAHTTYLHVYQRASERTSVGVRTRVAGEGGEHTGDVIPTKGRNNIGVDLLKS